MITQKELDIANTSYTNKDFGAVYTEILDYARKMSSLWSPQSSNESDPGVVLLKLLAFMADKLNFNLDKNILENFMLSATQESSMRRLCDMMGYYMNYYVSADTYVTFTYKGAELGNSEDEYREMTLPKFTTVISNDDNSLQYVLWEDAVLTSKNNSAAVEAKEGFLTTLNVGDSDKITLENLDSQNRLYFGEAQVAQNGVLIRQYNETDSNATFWTRVENLNVQDPGTKCFKFGYDSKEKLPYIEFPKDISSIIGEGLYIRYLVTAGYYGNVGVGNLNKLLSPTTASITGGSETVTISFTGEEGSTDLIIKNNAAALNGANPESIDSAYNNFKKTVGTFETLVTCRDYANHIYNNLYGNTGNHLVSNVQVGDRRTDLTHSEQIVTYGDVGQYNKNIAEEYTKLFIYALKGINNPKNDSEYLDSFKLTSKNESEYIAELLDATYNEDSLATISYKYQFPRAEELALIKILYNLDVKITTTYKVSVAEQLDIKRNIIEALRQRFYSRNIDYGYEIPYEEIYKCIMNSDERIKSIALKDPELSVEYVDGENNIMPICGYLAAEAGEDLDVNVPGDPEVQYYTRELSSAGEGYLNDGTYKYTAVASVPSTHAANVYFPLNRVGGYRESPYVNLIAKNTLSGKVPLFDFDKRFSYEFGMTPYMQNSQVVGPVLSKLRKFTSSSNISFTEVGQEKEVKQNEVIQLIGPKLVSSIGYGTYTNYRTNIDIKANVDTILSSTEYLLLVYTDSSQNQIEILYTDGDIIKSTFDIDASDFSTTPPTKTDKNLHNSSVIAKLQELEPSIDVTKVGCLGIPTNESIYKQDIVKHTFNSNIKVAWLVSDNVEDNILWNKFTETSAGSGVYEYVLSENEVFIYSVDGESSYEIFGSGTSLILEGGIQPSNIFSGACSIPNLDDLYEYGIESIASILKAVTFTSNSTFTIQANNILTLAQGDIAKISAKDGKTPTWPFALDNTWKSFADYVLEYKLVTDDVDAEFNKLPGYNIGESIYNNWRIRSRLDLVAGPNKTQVLEPHQTIIFTYGDDGEEATATVSGSNDGRIRLNIGIDISGGDNISLDIVDPTGILYDKGSEEHPLSALIFTDPENKSMNLIRSNGFYTRELNALGMSELSAGYNVLHPNGLSGSKTLVLVYAFFVESASDININIVGKDSSESNVDITDFGTGEVINQISSNNGQSQMYILEIPNTCTSFSMALTSSPETSVGTLRLGTLHYTNGLNSRFKFDEIESEYGIASGSLDDTLLAIIRELTNISESGRTVNIFDYIYDADSSKQIEEEDLTSPYAFYDQNNIASRYAISYVDVNNSSIEITRSSKL